MDDRYGPRGTSVGCIAAGGATAGTSDCGVARSSTTGALLPRETNLGLDRSSAPRNSGSVRLGPPGDRLLVPQWAYACVAAVPLSRPAAWLAASGASFVAGP